jgi:DNA-directed RNA polymerase subunit RPC12/RpoP
MFFVFVCALFVTIGFAADEIYDNSVNVWWMWVALGVFIASASLLVYGIYINVSYKCKECGRRIEPKSFWRWFGAMHCGLSRKMICPKCGKKVWAKLDLEDKEEKHL